jgi:NADP-dependent alcohol dehydrogenase
MQNFEFYNPTKIVFGQGEIAKLQELVSASRVLLLYGEGSIKKNGVYDQVMSALASKTIFEISGVKPNPTYEKAMEAVELIRKEKIEFILAVGGGSVIDSAKFIALAAPYSGEAWNILTQRDLPLKEAIPFGSVLTLPATGSEMNCYFVISKGDDKLSSGSPMVYPKFSILDPSVSFSLNDRQVGNGVVDAFVHVMEQYLTSDNKAPLQDRFAEAVLKTLIEEGPKSYLTKDYDARASHMWCATMALSSVFGVGVAQDWSTHMIGHELTAFYGMDHARSLAVVFPSMMWVMRKEKFSKIKQYGERIWNIPVNSDEDVKKVIQVTEEFFQKLGVPTKLKDYGIGAEAVSKVVDRFSSRGFEPMGESAGVTLEKVKEVLIGSLA